MDERTKPTKAATSALARLRTLALGFEGAWEDHPWGDTVYKVGAKVFCFSGADGNGFGLSVKLPQSRDAALTLPFAEPTRYGLGKSGWVSARFATAKDVPWPLLEAWVAESYAAIRGAAKKPRAAPRAKAPPRRRASAKR